MKTTLKRIYYRHINTSWRKEFRDNVIETSKEYGYVKRLDPSLPVFDKHVCTLACVEIDKHTGKLTGVGANPKLLELPDHGRRYIEIHEATHIEVPGHSEDFYTKLFNALKKEISRGEYSKEDIKELATMYKRDLKYGVDDHNLSLEAVANVLRPKAYELEDLAETKTK